MRGMHRHLHMQAAAFKITIALKLVNFVMPSSLSKLLLAPSVLGIFIPDI